MSKRKAHSTDSASSDDSHRPDGNDRARELLGAFDRIGRSDDPAAVVPDRLLRGATVMKDLDAAHEAELDAISLSGGESISLDDVDREASRGLWGGRLRVPERIEPSALQIVSLDPSGSGENDDASRQHPVDVEKYAPDELSNYVWIDVVRDLCDPLFFVRLLDAELCSALSGTPVHGNLERAMSAALVSVRIRAVDAWKRIAIDAGARYYSALLRPGHHQQQQQRLLPETVEDGHDAEDGATRRKKELLPPDQPLQLAFYVGRGAFAYIALDAADATGKREYVAHYYAPSSLRLAARAVTECKGITAAAAAADD